MDRPFQKRIILSDDVNRALERVECFLNRSGFLVRVARSGEEVLELTRQEPPDVILMNYYLAGLKGDDVCRALRSAPAGGRPVPLLVVGPDSPGEIEVRCRQAGCDEFIPSPAAPNLLLQLVENVQPAPAPDAAGGHDHAADR